MKGRRTAAKPRSKSRPPARTPHAAEIARRKARRQAMKGRHQISRGTLIAAEWVIIVTSLACDAFTTEDILALCPAVAHRTRVQAAEKPDRPERAAGDRRTFSQALSAGASSDDLVARTARGRVRGLSPPGACRLTRPDAWRPLLQLVAIHPSHHPAANNRPPATLRPGSTATPPRAAATTHLSETRSHILAPIEPRPGGGERSGRMRARDLPSP